MPQRKGEWRSPFDHLDECPFPEGRDIHTALETYHLPPRTHAPMEVRQKDALITCAHCDKVLQGIEWDNQTIYRQPGPFEIEFWMRGQEERKK